MPAPDAGITHTGRACVGETHEETEAARPRAVGGAACGKARQKMKPLRFAPPPPGLCIHPHTHPPHASTGGHHKHHKASASPSKSYPWGGAASQRASSFSQIALLLWLSQRARWHSLQNTTHTNT